MRQDAGEEFRYRVRSCLLWLIVVQQDAFGGAFGIVELAGARRPCDLARPSRIGAVPARVRLAGYPPMSNVAMLFVGILVALAGLFMAARATDDMFGFAGAAFAAFGILFAFGVIRRMTGQDNSDAARRRRNRVASTHRKDWSE